MMTGFLSERVLFFIYQESRTIYTTRPGRQKRSVLLFAGKAVILYGSSQEIKYGIPAEQEKVPDRRLSLKNGLKKTHKSS